MSQKTSKDSQITNKQSKNQSVTTIIILLITSFIFLKYIWVSNQAIKFQVGSSHVVFHSNWTSNTQAIHTQIQSLHQTLQLQRIKDVDISFAFSTSLNAEEVQQIIPQKFRQSLKKVKLNFGNTVIGNVGARWIINSLPSGLQKLELYFDSINSDSNLGLIIGEGVQKLQKLKQLSLSFILSGLKDVGANELFSRLKKLENLEKVSLVLMANQLTVNSSAEIKSFVTNLKNAHTLDLNLFSNKLEYNGIQPIAQAISTLNNLHTLDLDLYFNNITQVGTQSVAKAVQKLTNLNKLRLNLDFNYIKNQGAKYVSEALKSLTQLTELNLGVASKNFGYLGFKDIVKGIQSLVNLKRLTFRCGVNRVGMNGAKVVAQLFKIVNKIEFLELGFLQNYIGDEGAVILTKGIVQNLHNLRDLHLDIAFNDLKGYGGIQALKLLGTKTFDRLSVILTNNQFRDQQAKLIAKNLQPLIKSNKVFKFEFLNTAITQKGKAYIEKVFSDNIDSLIINNIQLVQTKKQQKTETKTEVKQQKKDQKGNDHHHHHHHNHKHNKNQQKTEKGKTQVIEDNNKENQNNQKAEQIIEL